MLRKECFGDGTCQISLRGTWAAFQFPFTCCYFLNFFVTFNGSQKVTSVWSRRLFPGEWGHILSLQRIQDIQRLPLRYWLLVLTIMFFYNGVFPFVADARYCSMAVVPLTDTSLSEPCRPLIFSWLGNMGVICLFLPLTKHRETCL